MNCIRYGSVKSKVEKKIYFLMRHKKLYFDEMCSTKNYTLIKCINDTYEQYRFAIVFDINKMKIHNIYLAFNYEFNDPFHLYKNEILSIKVSNNDNSIESLDLISLRSNMQYTIDLNIEDQYPLFNDRQECKYYIIKDLIIDNDGIILSNQRIDVTDDTHTDSHIIKLKSFSNLLNF